MKKVETEIKFEEALAKLEENVRRLENGELELAEALNVFKEGVELSKICFTQLEAAQKEIEKIIPRGGKEYELTPFREEEQ